jgi:hypothetical protein
VVLVSIQGRDIDVRVRRDEQTDIKKEGRKGKLGFRSGNERDWNGVYDGGYFASALA